MVSHNEHDIGTASVTKVGNLAIFNYTPENKTSHQNQEANKVKINFVFTVDNSASMSTLTQISANAFINGLIGGKIQGCATKGTLITFCEDAQVLAKNFDNPAILRGISLPRQGRTNITAGVGLALDSIIDAAKLENQAIKKMATAMTNDNNNNNNNKSTSSTIHALVFLSDGAHNCGTPINDEFIKKYKSKITNNNIKLVIIVVGIIHNDVALGMRVKELETVRTTGLDPVYYAKDVNAFQGVLDNLVSGLSSSFATGISKTFSVSGSGALFLENMQKETAAMVDRDSHASHVLPVFLPHLDNKQKMMMLAATSEKGENNNDTEDDDNDDENTILAKILPQLFVDGVPVPTQIVDFTERDITSVFDAIIPVLGQLRVAHGTDAIKTHIAVLESSLDVADQVVNEMENRRMRELEEKKNAADNKNNKDNNTTKATRHAVTGAERARMLKMAKQTRHRFAEERAQLKRLVATLSNNSQEQASFLNGVSRKFAAKALMRSTVSADTVNAASILASLRSDDFLKGLRDALAKDKELFNQRPAGVNDNSTPCSILSLQTAMETYEEWLTLLEKNPGESVIDAEDVYSCLVAFSLHGHPVQFNQAASAQMQPLTTQCIDVDPTPVDTASVMLAKQSKFELKGQMGKVINQVFAAVDPSCPNASAYILRRSQIAQINNSVNICADLFMVNGEQQIAQHVHAFSKAVEKMYAGSASSSVINKSYASLAIKILYSFRRIFPRMNEKQSSLFNRWFLEYATITTSEDDECVSPMLLPFLLGLANLDEAIAPSNDLKRSILEESRTPCINLLNEWLARKCKMILSSYTYAKKHANTVESAHEILKKYFSINKYNSPAPVQDVLEGEPSIESVKENTQHWVEDKDINPSILASVFPSSTGSKNTTNNDDVSDNTRDVVVTAENVVMRGIESIYLAYKFSRSLQLFFIEENENKKKQQGTNTTSNGTVVIDSWKALSDSIETNLEVPDRLVSFIANRENNNTSSDQADEIFNNIIMVPNNNNDNKKAHNAAEVAGPQLKHSRDQIFQCMLAQALLYHESSARKDVDQHDISDPVTLQNMIISLRLSVYFDALQVKKAEYLSIIGDVSYAEGLQADDIKFADMCGAHSHGLTWQVFWSLLRSCANNESKKQIFMSKSNHCVQNEETFQKMLKSGRRGARKS